MGIVDYDQQLDTTAEPPPGCDRDSLWWALVTVASQRYDELTQQEAEAAKVEEPPSPVVQVEETPSPVVQVEGPLSLVQVQDREVDKDDVVEDGDDRLVIDEAEPSESPTTPRMAKRKVSEGSSSENYEVQVRYNANMARRFPGAENRTPEQQAVRQRNTVAARQSRAKMRIMEEMLTQEASVERKMNYFMKERIAACFNYGNLLRDILKLDEADFWAEFQLVKDEYIAEPLRSQHVVPRNVNSDGSNSDYQDYSDDGEEEDEDEEEEVEEDEPQPGPSRSTAGNRGG